MEKELLWETIKQNSVLYKEWSACNVNYENIMPEEEYKKIIQEFLWEKVSKEELELRKLLVALNIDLEYHFKLRLKKPKRTKDNFWLYPDFVLEAMEWIEFYWMPFLNYIVIATYYLVELLKSNWNKEAADWVCKNEKWSNVTVYFNEVNVLGLVSKNEEIDCYNTVPIKKINWIIDWVKDEVEKIGGPIKYVSTRWNTTEYSFSEAIMRWSWVDWWLFLPKNIPQISLEEINKMQSQSYAYIAQMIFEKFNTWIKPDIIKSILEKAYNKKNFHGFKEITPLRTLKGKNGEERISILELGKWPTFAFKDMALQVFFQLLGVALKEKNAKEQTNYKQAIIWSTSWDTWKAAIEWCAWVEGLQCVFVYPKWGVSAIQEKMMTTQKWDNVWVIWINWNFDDWQKAVTKILNSEDFRKYMKEKNNTLITSANSINWWRLIPQTVYYFSAYSQLLRNKKIKPWEKINFVVPTWNFWNIFAWYYAKKMWLPIDKLVLANNENDVLDYFIKTWKYDISDRVLIKTSSPSMDILISKNLERMLFMVTDWNSEKVRTWMESLEKDKFFEIDNETLVKIQETFVSSAASKKQTVQSIAKTYNENRYILDPHWAVAMKVARELEEYLEWQIVVLETAEPLKFPEAVYEAIIWKVNWKDSFELLKEIKNHVWDMLFLPEEVMALQEKQDIHTKVVNADEKSIKEGFINFIENRI